MANDLAAFITKINNAVRSEKNMRTALTTVMAVHKPRIFEKGMDASNGKIGVYGKNPISIPFDNMARKVGSPKTIVKNRRFNAPIVRETKSAYFKGGYAEYKTEVGKNPGFVILRNTDQMMMDYGLIFSGGKFGFGFQNDLNYNKSQWMQDKYDKNIFDHSDSEINLLADVLKAEVLKSI